MTAINKFDEDRRLIPHWGFYGASPASAEFSGDWSKPNLFSPNPQFLREKVRNWTLSPSIATAADVVACVATTGEFHQGRACAHFLLNHRDRITQSVHRLAQYVLRPLHTSESTEACSHADQNQVKISRFTAVREAKARLWQNPRNVLAWIDLSLCYTTLGQTSHAEHAMENALRLAPLHRYVLRSATRLFVHMGDISRAHELLYRCERTPTDPWLLAAEISVAIIREAPQHHIKNAQNIIASENAPPQHLSELHGALGTLNYFEGKMKFAKRNFDTSLIEPTDNAVAQAYWAKKRGIYLKNLQNAESFPRAFEAHYIESDQKKQWKQSLSSCFKWLADEPFSSRPAIQGSYIGTSLTADYLGAESIARMGLLADPGDKTLLNNLTVALAYQGKLSEAKQIFDQINSADDSYPEYVHLATKGLIDFRKGKIKSGRSLYEKAENLAPKEHKPLVVTYRANEEYMARTDLASETRRRARAEISKSSNPLLRDLYERLIGYRK